MNIQIETRTRFRRLLASKYPSLKSTEKWRQTMWHNDGSLVVSLIFLSKKIKFCFFNNPNIELDRLQRWSSNIYSQNREYENGMEIDWERISELINTTMQIQSK